MAENIKLKIVDFFVEPSVKDKYYKEFTEAYKRLAKFFPVSPSLVEIYLFSNRSDFINKIGKKKVPNWLMGYTSMNSINKIFIYTKDSRLSSKVKLKKLIHHELAHVFTNHFNSALPTWLKEGISVYLAKQITKSFISESDWQIIKPNKNYNFFGRTWNSLINNHHAYNNAGLVVRRLIKSYGKENLFNILAEYQPKQNIILLLSSFFKKSSHSIILDLANKKRRPIN
ncbi:MAG: hypothetical protein V1712_04100 [Patescibacteria group bacterium]